jgi:hypothetical protein
LVHLLPNDITHCDLRGSGGILGGEIFTGLLCRYAAPCDKDQGDY